MTEQFFLRDPFEPADVAKMEDWVKERCDKGWLIINRSRFDGALIVTMWDGSIPDDLPHLLSQARR